MVRDKVDDYFEAVFMGSSDHFFELLHSLVRIVSKICVDVVIVAYGIRRSSQENGGVRRNDQKNP